MYWPFSIFLVKSKKYSIGKFFASILCCWERALTFHFFLIQGRDAIFWADGREEVKGFVQKCCKKASTVNPLFLLLFQCKYHRNLTSLHQIVIWYLEVEIRWDIRGRRLVDPTLPKFLQENFFLVLYLMVVLPNTWLFWWFLMVVWPT